MWFIYSLIAAVVYSTLWLFARASRLPSDDAKRNGRTRRKQQADEDPSLTSTLSVVEELLEKAETEIATLLKPVAHSYELYLDKAD